MNSSHLGRYACVFLSLALSACGADGVEDDSGLTTDSGYSQEDSAGVQISVSDAFRANGPLDWALDSVPEVILGDEDNPDKQFFGIGGLRGLEGGGVLVVDGISRELRYFDSHGQLTHRAGGRGEGPGEFDGPNLVPTLGTDSLLFWDRGLKRFQLFSSDGESSRTIRLLKRWPAGARPPVGAVGLEMLVRKPDPITREMFSTEGPISNNVDFVWLDPLTGDEILIASFIENLLFKSGPYRGSGGATFLIPFTPHPVATVTSAGALITNGTAPEIREYDLEGSLRRVFRIDQTGRPVTQEMIEGMLDLEVVLNGGRPDFWEWLYGQMPLPDTLPSFRSLQVDEMGWVWAQVFEWDPSLPVKWVIFDQDGRAQGSLATPPGLEIYRIGEDFVVGVWKDDLGVEYVKRYRLWRGPEGP